MTPSVKLKEEAAVTPPETSAAFCGTEEASQSLKKGPWTAAEDAILIEYVKKYGEGNWNAVQKNVGLQRCGKSCRLRWANHLRPSLKKGSFTPDEEGMIIKLHSQLGNKWARMAAHLPGRTDNEIKNYWNTRIKRRQRAGLPLYPPEILHQIALMNHKKQGALMLHQNQARPKNFISNISPNTTTLFNNTGTNNNNTNYLYTSPQQLRSPTFATKMNLPSTQSFSCSACDQKLPTPLIPSMMGQSNNMIFIEPLSREPPMSSPKPLPISIINHSMTNPLCKPRNSDISNGTQVMKQPVKTMVNQTVSNLPEMNTYHKTLMPAEKMLSDLCEFSPLSEVTEDDLRIHMQQLASTLSMTHD